MPLGGAAGGARYGSSDGGIATGYAAAMRALAALALSVVVVTGAGGERYWTDDHDSFSRIER